MSIKGIGQMGVKKKAADGYLCRAKRIREVRKTPGRSSRRTMLHMSEGNSPDRLQAGTWIEIPRQPKQNRCHQCKKRTFFWTLEPEGYVCRTCVNLRNMPQIPPANPSNSGKKSRSTIAPATKNAILARRANGQSKLSIARDVHVAPGTVRKVLDEADFDQLIQQGRSDCAVHLLPLALEGLKKAFAKGDGAACLRFLEGMGVLGEDKSRRNGTMQFNPVLHQQIINLVQPRPTRAGEQPCVISISPKSSQP